MNENWKYVPFDQVFEWSAKSSIGSREGKTSGKYKLFIASATEIKFYDTYLESGESLVFGTGGNPCIHYVNENFAYTNHTEVAKKKLNVNTKFYYYFFQKDRYAALQSTFVGGGIKNSSKKKIGSLLVPVLSLDEQEYIVSKIEELFSQLDSGIETLKTIREELSTYRQSVFEHYFNHPANAKLRDLCHFITKGTTPSKDKLYERQGEVPFLKVYNLTFDALLDFSIAPTYISRQTHTTELGRSVVYPGDVLMNIVGPPLGKVSIVPDTHQEWNINQAIARFRCKDKLLNKYLAYYLLYHQTRAILEKKAKATAGQVNLTLEICRELAIPLLPISEQIQIVKEIETRLSLCNYIGKSVDAALQQSEAMRQSILKKAFEGKL